jgi:YfiH family protein
MSKVIFSLFKSYPIITALSNKSDGSMKVNGDAFEHHNRTQFLKRFKINSLDVVSAWLGHKDKCRVFYKGDAPSIIKGVDGLFTQDEIFLSVTVSDCLPIYMYGPKTKTVGIIHAGWSGLTLGIIPKAIQLMKRQLLNDPKNILVGIGPSIGVCHYEIKEDLIKKIPSSLSGSLEEKDGKTFWNLKEVARNQLVAEGIQEKNIEVNPICTFCSSRQYFSFRREKPDEPENLNVMMAVIGMLK